MSSPHSAAIAKTEEYYDSIEADEFYQKFWGGEDIHVGLYATPDKDIAKASHRTIVTMAGQLDALGPHSKIIDLGSGYGGSARYLASEFKCHVDCLNLSRTQNTLNQQKNLTASLTGLLNVVHGSFEDVPAPDGIYDVVWSQDAILHSEHRTRVLDEIARVLKSGGDLIFTDPMQADDCPGAVLQPILDRIHLKTLGSFAFYRKELTRRGFHEVSVKPMLNQFRTHYARIGEELQARYEEAVNLSGQTYVDNMLKGLTHWVAGADDGYLAWGIMHFRKGQ